MPDLLLELFSEEIPARMQRQAAEDLRRLVTDALVERNLLYEGAHAFVTPRRLALHVVGLPAAQPDRREEPFSCGAEDTRLQEVDLASPVHLAFDALQLGDLALGLTLGPG